MQKMKKSGFHFILHGGIYPLLVINFTSGFSLRLFSIIMGYSSESVVLLNRFLNVPDAG